MASEQNPADRHFLPGAPQKTLARFEGAWRAEVKIWFDPTGEPNISHGTMNNKMIIGSRFLEQVYASDDGTFEGRGFWGHNDVDQRYEGFWIDSMATFFHLEYGQHDPSNDTYTMTGSMTNPQTGQPLQKRSVIRYLGPDEHTLEMFFDSDQGAVRTMEIRYRRA